MTAWQGVAVLLLLSVAQYTRSEVYTSVADLKEIGNFLLQFSHKFADSPLAQSPLVQKISQLVECLFDVTGAAQINPISAIKMIALLTVELDGERELFQLIKDEAAALHVTLPTNVDLVGSVNALARLQMTYGVTISQVMQGYFTQLHRTPMAAVCVDRLRPDASDCSVIAKNLKTHQSLLFSLSKQWMYEAVNLSALSESSLVDAVRKHATGSSEVARTLKELLDRIDADPRLDVRKAIDWLLADQSVYLYALSDSNDLTGWARSYNEYSRLCRASAIETYVPQEKRSELVCAYLVLGNPYFLIGPVKTEWISYYPEVRVYHDVIHNSEIAATKQLAKLVLSRSGLYNVAEDYYDQRVSKTAWLTLPLPQSDPVFDEVVERLNHRSNLLARLNAEGTEDPQVLNYGLGGQYEPHHDYFGEGTSDYRFITYGNRIATLMYYLSDVDAGGSTVFTELGVGVHPQKGSAIFWYNLMKSGERNLLSMHAGCPVMVGEKWVLNKWYRFEPQFDALPCETDPNAY